MGCPGSPDLGMKAQAADAAEPLVAEPPEGGDAPPGGDGPPARARGAPRGPRAALAAAAGCSLLAAGVLAAAPREPAGRGRGPAPERHVTLAEIAGITTEDEVEVAEVRQLIGTTTSQADPHSEQAKKADIDSEEDCEEVAPDSRCFKSVTWVFHTGLSEHPGWYAGLGRAPTFEAVQAHLHAEDADSECPKPCECKTAVHGDTCNSAVGWVVQDGLKKHPEWYRGLNKSSSRRDVQRLLSKQDPDSGCQRPCQERVRPPGGLPSLFCFAVAQPSGDEAKLISAQAKRGAGIFACNDFAVLCQEQVSFHGVDSRDVITFEPASVGLSKDGTAGNAELFMNVWRAVGEDGRYKSHDWTIKVDPDTVLFPDRLRTALAKPIYKGATDEAGPGAFVKQCSKWEGPGWPAMFGSIEAVSTPAVDSYLRGAGRCKSELKWQDWGEDLYLASCFEQVVMVPGIGDISISGDDVCKGNGPAAGPSTGATCWDGQKASYHPFKNADDWFRCHDQPTTG